MAYSKEDASDVAYTATITGIKGEKAENYELPSSGLTCEYIIRKAEQVTIETVFLKSTIVYT